MHGSGISGLRATHTTNFGVGLDILGHAWARNLVTGHCPFSTRPCGPVYRDTHIQRCGWAAPIGACPTNILGAPWARPEMLMSFFEPFGIMLGGVTSCVRPQRALFHPYTSSDYHLKPRCVCMLKAKASLVSCPDTVLSTLVGCSN